MHRTGTVDAHGTLHGNLVMVGGGVGGSVKTSAPNSASRVSLSGNGYELKAQNPAGYIETRSGRTVAYALMVDDAGPVANIQDDVGAVFEDEGTISSIIYESL